MADPAVERPAIMTRASTASDRTGHALALLLGVLALYGCWSASGLAARWGASTGGVALFAAWLVAVGWWLMAAARRASRTAWVAIAVFVVAFRIASLILVDGRDSPGDPHRYLDLAQHLLAGEGLFTDDPGLAARVWAMYPPAYPLLLAGWGAVAGLSGASLLALSTVLDVATAALVAALGARLGERGAGIAAAALYLIWPSTLFDAPLAQKESLELLLVLALAHGWVGVPGRTVPRSAFAIGVPAGLLALTQPGVAALAGLIGVAIAPRIGWRRMIVAGMAGAVVAVLVMVPWWWRNWQIFGAFVPLTSVGGVSLWVGENPDATGNWMPYHPALVGHGEIESARRAGRLAVAWMTEHPVDVLKLNAAKFVRAMAVGHFPLVRLGAMTPPPAAATTAALFPLTHGSHLLLLAAGAAALSMRRSPVLVMLIAATVAQLLLFGVWFEFGERHRIILTPFLLLAIAIGSRAVTPRRLHPDRN